MNLEQWAKINEIFSEALELSADERENYIAEQCGDNQILLAEIKSLLEAHHQSENFIESPALAPITRFVENSLKPSYIGKTVGAYKIEKEIGKGGMGTVFLAVRDDREFKKKVAVKLIKHGFDTDEIVRRFRHERQILATLEHSNITRLIDGGSTEDGLPYLVMDYVEGQPLTKYCDENELSINERLEIFLKICGAVSYAHKNLIIHRDLKPSNILVTPDGTPKLLDFGIAKLTAANSGTQTLDRNFTVFQAMTPEYASPEQVVGHPITTSSDIYSLGVVLYELLTGHRPYDFRTNSADEITRTIIETSPTKPSSICRWRGLKVAMQNPASAVRKLQGDLDNIILMAMRKEPERRYSSVEQLADDIRRYLNGLPVIAQEDTFSYRAGKFITRHKAGVSAALGIAASLVAGIIVAARQAKIAKRERDISRMEAEKAKTISKFLKKMLNSADPRVGSKDVKVIEVLATTAESIERDFTNQPEIAAELHSTIGLTYLSVNLFEPAETHLKIALEISLAVFPRRSPQVAASLANYGKLFQTKGHLSDAEPLFREALEILRQQPGASLELAEVLENYGYLLALKGEGEKAIRLHEEEVAIRRRILGENHPDLAKSLGSLGRDLAIIDRQEAAEPLLRKSLKIMRDFHRGEHPDVALAMIDLAGTIYPNEPFEAENLCREALLMYRKLLGDEHADTAWALYRLAFVLINSERYDEAEHYLREILSRRGGVLPEEHPVLASSLLLLGRVFMTRKNYHESKSAFLECLELRLRSLPAGHWLLASTKSFLGESLIHLGETETGRRMMLENYQIIKEKLGAKHQQTRQALERLRKFGR